MNPMRSLPGWLLVCWLGLVGWTAWGAAPPNIVLFLADDLGWADVPWHGSLSRMPHLDRLAREGVRLEAHYVHPMCSPTRAALMTGRYASRFGVTKAQNPRALPWNTLTLARALKSAGYDTALVGKWHLGSRPEEGPQRFGFDHAYGSLAGGCGPYDHRYKEGEFTRTWHRNGQLLEEEGHVTDLIAREAVGWLERRAGPPFFLYVPFTAIHVPMREPEPWLQTNAHLTDPGQRLRAACASHLDDAIGQVLAVLDRKRLRENTVVLFLSDNGAHAPSDNQGGPYPGDYEPLQVGHHNRPLRGHKSSVYDGGIRTPGVVHWPGRLAPGQVHTPLHAVDWMPTLCRLAGAQVPADLKWDGMDVWPVLQQPAGTWPARTLYSAGTDFRSQMIRHGDWKLVVDHRAASGTAQSTAKPTEELFNLAEDPSESKNLALQQAGILAEMRRRLAEVSARDNDALAAASPAAEPVSSPWRIAREGEGWQLLRGGQPFYLQGAVAPNRFDLLKACGGNAVRAGANRAALDAAHQAGLVVMANLPVRGERNGLDWNNADQVSAQQGKVLAVVKELKDHPALLFWAVGNELDHIPGNRPYQPELWTRLNDLAIAIKQVDPHHPVMTVVGTGRYEKKIQEIAAGCPDLDLLGLNAYGDLPSASALTRRHWPKPYVVSEWGPTGHWEVPKTPWGAPLEQTSSEKAHVIADRYQNIIRADRTHCLGSLVFYWSEKQETTHTWYGLFCHGQRTESIDVMQRAWTGVWPTNRAPAILRLGITGFPDPKSIRLRKSATHQAQAQFSDPDADPLTVTWDVRPEVVIPPGSYAGGLEKPVQPLAGLIADPAGPTISFTAPAEPGAYRLFVTATDGQGHVAYGNLPFLVEE